MPHSILKIAFSAAAISQESLQMSFFFSQTRQKDHFLNKGKALVWPLPIGDYFHDFGFCVNNPYRAEFLWGSSHNTCKVGSINAACCHIEGVYYSRISHTGVSPKLLDWRQRVPLLSCNNAMLSPRGGSICALWLIHITSMVFHLG